jgi:membrane protein EpsK
VYGTSNEVGVSPGEGQIGGAPPGQKVLRDIGLNLASYVASLFAMLFYSPFLVSRLGVAAYGFVPMTINAVQYLGVVTGALQLSTGRSLAAALQAEDETRPSAVMSTAVWALLGLLAALLPALLPLAWGADRLLHTPEGLEVEVRWLALGALLMFFLGALASVLELVAYVRGRFDLRSVMVVASTVVRVGVPVGLISALGPRLRYIGVGLVAGALVHLVFAAFSARRLLPSLRVSPRLASARVLRELASVGGWTIANQLGVLLFLNADLLVVNRVLGSRASGDYSLVLVWSTLLITVGSAAANAFGPRILASVAGDRPEETVVIARDGVRVVSVMMALPVGLIAGFAGPLLRAWQGPGFEHLAPVLTLVVILLGFSLGYQPLATVFLAHQALRLPSLVQLVAGMFSVSCGYLLARHTSLGLFAPALAGGLTLALRSCLFTPLYAASLMGLPRGIFLRQVALAVLTTLGVMGLGRLIANAVAPRGWLQLGAAASLVAFRYLLVAWFLLLSTAQRAALVQRLRRRS